jgi:hypothetical protein
LPCIDATSTAVDRRAAHGEADQRFMFCTVPVHACYKL